MSEVLLKSGTLVFLIVLGYTLKCLGLFKQEDSKLLSKIMIYVTLPAILINAMRDFRLDVNLLSMMFLCIAACIVMAAVGWLVGKREDPVSHAMYTVCAAGFNIGSFAMPFIQFILPAGMTSVVMFDVGNSIMCCGGVYSVASMATHPEDRFSLKIMGRTLLHSFPFVLYMVLLCLNLLGVRFPEQVYQVADIVAGGNAVVVMLMLGILFEVKLTKTARRQVFEIVILRVVTGAVLALLAWFLLPLPLVQRQVLVLMLFCPITSMATVFCGKMNCDPDVYGTATSLTIPISVAMMVGLGALWAA